MPSNNNKISNAFYALILVFVAYIGVMTHAQAATLVSGAITTNTSWTLAQSPYQVTADVVIQNGAVLSIEPGVTIGFDAGTNLTIGIGSLNARGTAGQPIVFTSSLEVAGGVPNAGDWGQIRFLDGSNDLTTLVENAQIRYGKGISIQAASPTFNYLQLSNNLGAAISIDLASSPKGIGNQATRNTLNGVSVPSGDVSGAVTWGIKGIPYVVQTGVVSVGVSPTISSINPIEVQQSLSVDAVINGKRLAGADAVNFEAANINATLLGGGNDTTLPVRITVGASQALGNVPFNVKTAAGWTRYANGIAVIPLKPTINVSAITPNNMRRGETKSFQISGTTLLGATVSTQLGGGLTLSALQTTDTLANFSLTAAATAQLGTQSLTISNPAHANGVGALLVTIVDALPKINTNTIPSAVIPDAVARPFTLSLTNTDTVDHTVSLSTLDPSIISVSPATVVIAAGATSAPINIAGLKLGYTMLNITSPTLAAVSKQIYATSLLNGSVVDPVLSAPVGVLVPLDFANLPVGTVVPISSKTVGVAVPYNSASTFPVGSVAAITSRTVGVDVPYNSASTFPVGSVAAITSRTVGVDVPYNLLALPIGSVVGPALSPLVGVNVP